MSNRNFCGVLTLLCLTLTGVLACSSGFSDSETLAHGRFQSVHVYKPKSEVQHFALFFSGDGGWDDDLGDIAKALAAQGTLVAGIDTAELFKELEKDGGKCVFPVGDMENLSHFVQAYYKVPTYFTPILIGHSAGASLAYAALAQAPKGTFTGGLSLSFCADLDLRKPLCKAGSLDYTVRSDGGVVYASHRPRALCRLPGSRFTVPRTKCARSTKRARSSRKTPGARFVALPGVTHSYDDMETWLPQFDAAYTSITALEPPHLQAPPHSLADLPIVEVPPTGSGNEDTFAVLFSEMAVGRDRSRGSDVLASRGIPVAGWDSLRYFWTPRTPSGVSVDLDRILRYYAEHWHRQKALVVGYSQGADVLPFAVNRLPPQSRALVARTVLMSIGQTAAFEFHVTNWFGSGNHELPIGVEMEKMPGASTLCLYGEGDTDTICPKVGPAHAIVIKLAGGHHFGGAVMSISRTLSCQRQRRPRAGRTMRSSRCSEMGSGSVQRPVCTREVWMMVLRGATSQ